MQMILKPNNDEFFQTKDVTISFDGIFESYGVDLAGIKSISEFVSNKTGLINYFTTGNRVNTYMSIEMFQVEGAIAALNSDYWSRVINMTDIINCMPAEKRNEWSNMIHERKTPTFDRETVVATIGNLLSSRGMFFADKVDGVFKHLSGKHVTNSPMAFKEKMIIDYVIDKFGYIQHQRVEYIHDLRCIIAQLRNLDQPAHWITSDSLRIIAKDKKFGEWFDFDGGAFRAKLFKIGTAHIEIHPEMAQKLNRVLASKYPEAIPAGVRDNVKQVKSRPLSNNSISFKAVSVIADIARSIRTENCVYKNLNELDKTIKAEVMSVITFLDGSYASGKISFKSCPSEALSIIVRTCSLPDIKSHQYYPTKNELAEIMVGMAEISDLDSILEPSAGQGGIADHLPKENLTCIEINEVNAAVLTEKGFKVTRSDFLTFDSSNKFNKIIMNPPFADNQAKEHTIKAYSHLKDQGILVACLPVSLKNKDLIKGVSHEWSEVFEDSFDGTSVRVALLRLIRV